MKYKRYSLLLVASFFLAGCVVIGPGPVNNDNSVGNDNNDNGDVDNNNDNLVNANDNLDNENDNSVVLIELNAIDFQGDVPTNVDPTSIEIGGGMVQFSGGNATIIGVLPLYFDDSFAWILEPAGTATITFVDLDVRSLSVYFAHDDFIGATMSIEDSEGTVIDSINSFAAVARGDEDAVFEIDGGGASITQLTVVVPGAAVLSIDHLVLFVAE